MTGILAAATLLAAVLLPGVADARYASPLMPLLLKPGEIGGIVPGKPQVFRTVAAIKNASGARPTEAELRRYEGEGFVEAAISRIHDEAEPAARGVSSVFEFQAPAGAQAEMKSELRKATGPEARRIAKNRYLVLRRFTVPGVPESVGFALESNAAAAKLGYESGLAKGWFIEGNCLVAIGVLRPSSSRNVAGPVIDGVQTISRRSAGACS